MTMLKMDITDTLSELCAGDIVSLSGIIFIARDSAHQYALKNHYFEPFKNAVIYHCGPICRAGKIISAGPTTSARMNSLTPPIINKYGIKAIIGKGGMNNEVALTLKKHQAVYFTAIGGCGTYAQNMELLKNYFLDELGEAEAIYQIRATNFEVITTIDAKGGNIHQEVLDYSRAKYLELA